MKETPKTEQEVREQAATAASAHLSLALDQLLIRLDKSKSQLVRAEVLATIDRAIAW